jgi:hypothetical protein
VRTMDIQAIVQLENLGAARGSTPGRGGLGTLTGDFDDTRGGNGAEDCMSQFCGYARSYFVIRLLYTVARTYYSYNSATITLVGICTHSYSYMCDTALPLYG